MQTAPGAAQVAAPPPKQRRVKFDLKATQVVKYRKMERVVALKKKASTEGGGSRTKGVLRRR